MRIRKPEFETSQDIRYYSADLSNIWFKICKTPFSFFSSARQPTRIWIFLTLKNTIQKQKWIKILSIAGAGKLPNLTAK